MLGSRAESVSDQLRQSCQCNVILSSSTLPCNILCGHLLSYYCNVFTVEVTKGGFQQPSHGISPLRGSPMTRFFQNVCLFAFLFFPSVCLSVCLSFVQLLQTVGSRVCGMGMGFTVASVGAINPRPELFVLAATASHTFTLSK